MKTKALSFLSLLTVGLMAGSAAHADMTLDTADPLYMLSEKSLLSQSSISFMDDTLVVAQKFSYGLNNRLTLGADIKYQQDFNGDEDGFSNIGLDGVYRMSGPDDGNSRIISDALFGINFGGSTRVRSPDFADTIYYAGIRMGRQWSWITLAGTLKTSWIFDETRGMAYIDLVPEAYFRMSEDWTAGAGFTLRKSTNPNFDQEWINLKLIRRYGNTQYIAHVDYEFESEEYRFGMNVNILF